MCHYAQNKISVSQSSWCFLSIINLSSCCWSQQEITPHCVSLQLVSCPDLSKTMQLMLLYGNANVNTSSAMLLVVLQSLI